MKCLNCGVKTSFDKNYCSMKCRKEYSRKKCEKILKKVENYFQLVFSGRYSNQTKPKRIYCYICCVIEKLPKLAAGDVAKFNHTTIEYHIKSITEEEIILAKKISENNYQPKEHYKFEKPSKHINIYEKTGFRYDNGRKECSTKWKRIKQWKMS